MPPASPPPLEFFPIDIGDYRHHPPLPTAEEVEAVAAELAPFAPRYQPWQVAGSERTADAVQQRLSEWAHPSSTGNTILYWAGHGESDGETALLAHTGSPHPLVHSGISPQDILTYLTARQNHPDAEDTWAIVVIDACKSGRFIELLSAQAHLKTNGPRNFLLVATSQDGDANLGVFRHALHTVLGTTFAADSTIDLRALGDELNRNLHGCPVLPHTDTGRALLHRAVPAAAGAVTTTLDMLAEIQAVIDQLPRDEQKHFLPKAAGAELGELAWYFEGRQQERDTILCWLDTTTNGMLVVTGAAGSGKSALLGHILLHTRPDLSSILRRSGHLSPLPAGIPCPSDHFDAVIHLTGTTPQNLIARLALAARLHEAPRDRPLNEQIDWLLGELRLRAQPFTVLLDALDEAQTPLVIADQIIRRLAELPSTRVVVGTRRSTKEGPDLPQPADTNLLDALGTNRTATDQPHATVSVERDADAMVRYIRRRLQRAVQLGKLTASPTQITQASADLENSGHEFLHARLAVHEIIHDPRLLHDPTPLRNSSHRQLFARAVHRLSARNPAFQPLLHALALAQGRGLPVRDGIWSTIAAAIAPQDTAIPDRAISDLKAEAAPYLMLDTEAEQSVYRHAHRTFSEHFAQAGQADERLHQRITAALTTQADSLRLPEAELNPYVAQYLSAHAGQGRLPAWQNLAQHTRVLDRLDPISITSQVMTHAFGRITLPPAIAGAVASQHLAATSSSSNRRGLREVAAAQVTGSFHRPLTEPEDTLPAWSVTWASLKIKPMHLTLHAHTGAVSAVAGFAAADGRPLLATTGDGTVRVWDPLSGTPVGQPLTGHTGTVRAAAAFTASDGRTLLATGSGNGAVRVWDALSGTPVGQPLTGHTGWVLAVAAFPAPDGRTLLATGGYDGAVRVWDALSGTRVGQPLTGHAHGVGAVVGFATADGRTLLATGDSDGTVRVWDALAGTPVGQPLTGHTGWVLAVAAFTAPDGRTLLATSSSDGTVRVWDALAGTPVGQHLSGINGPEEAVAAFPAPDGRTLLATGDRDGTVRVWDALSGTPVGQPLTRDAHWVGAVTAFTAADGRTLLATGSDDRRVRVWDALSGTPVGQTLTTQPLTNRAGRVWAVLTGRNRVWAVTAFTASDGRTLLAASGDDRRVRIWDALSGTPVGQPLTGHTGWVLAVAAFTASDGRTLLATGSRDGTVRIWDPLAGTPVGQPLTTPHPTNRTGRVWAALTGRTQVRAVAAFTAADGRTLLATGSDDRTVRVWDPLAGTPVGQPLTGHTGPVQAVAAFPAADGRTLLATGSDDGRLRVWDPLAGTPVGQPLTGHTGPVRAVAAFPASDGRTLLATGSDDRTVRIWDLEAETSAVIPLNFGVGNLAGVNGDLAIAGPDGILVISLHGNIA
ncbi:WD40 repeat domain-containing protein [Streptomyces sp. PA03-3a]|nr:WD40 repeat domain-containing protein [Streptomyces sp. PA03-3a]